MNYLSEEYLRDLGIADLPEDLKKPLVEGLEKQIQDRISLEMAQGLTDEQLEELANISEGEDEEKVKAWLGQNVPNFEEIVKNVLISVRDEIVAMKAEVLDKPNDNTSETQ